MRVTGNVPVEQFGEGARSTALRRRRSAAPLR